MKSADDNPYDAPQAAVQPLPAQPFAERETPRHSRYWYIYLSVGCLALGVLCMAYFVGTSVGSMGAIAIGSVPAAALFGMAAWLIRDAISPAVTFIVGFALSLIFAWLLFR
jgi:hypothetical protein